MIPQNIERGNIVQAIQEIEKSGIPSERNSKKFLLEYRNKFYPPKYVISLANRFANGEALNPSKFSGGSETNDFLTELGFHIVGPRSKTRKAFPLHVKKPKGTVVSHSERCPKCKRTFALFLEQIFGEVVANYRFDIAPYPESFKETKYYEDLKAIYRMLQKHRNFNDLCRRETLPNCDFFVPSARVIVEFDESQHFTLPRKIALENYPDSIAIGFDRNKWETLCEKLDARDNDPPYRDEQRAWYDTLRDFLPSIKQLSPTIRVFASDFVRCSLNPNIPAHAVKFQDLLGIRADKNKYAREETALARIIITGEKWKGEPEESRSILEHVYKNWPKNKKSKFLVTCGGFVQFDWPKTISYEDIGDNRYPNKKVMDELVKKAKGAVDRVLNDDLRNKLRDVTDYITVGVDSTKEKISTTQNYINEYHAELVFIVGLKNKKVYWTGKSYPTPNQQDTLIRIPDLKTHFLRLNGIGKIMVLGCHDLTIFNPRSNNAKGWRRKVNKEFRELAKNENPDWVLQHPHTTDSTLTWSAAWNNLKRSLPSVKKYASAGVYFNSEGVRSALNDVLEKTAQATIINFVVQRTKQDDWKVHLID